ncbi:MAG: hypothetical protein KAR57_04080 [Bacteroidales bacterium]|nr:hypothetical protein [Bacteroidales bacterium]
MKKLLIIALLLITSTTFAQNFYVEVEPKSITKPEMEDEVIDSSIFTDLEKFNDENDAIIYVIRSKSMVGAAVKWFVEADKELIAKIKNKEYCVVHMDGTEEGHSFLFPNLKLNYTNIKPNRIYYIRFKGFDIKTGYFNQFALDELKKVNLTAPLKE